MSGNSTQVASKIELPEWVDKQAQQNMGIANELAEKPYQAYSGARTADFTPDQLNAMSAIRSSQGQGQSAIAKALNQSAGVGSQGAPMIGGSMPAVDAGMQMRGGSIGTNPMDRRMAGYGAEGLARLQGQDRSYEAMRQGFGMGQGEVNGLTAMMNSGDGMPPGIADFMRQLNSGGSSISLPPGSGGPAPMTGGGDPYASITGQGWQPEGLQMVGQTPSLNPSLIDPAAIERAKAASMTGALVDPSTLERVQAQNVQAGTIAQSNIDPYLNQYRQAALDPALQEIQRQSQIMLGNNAARATSSGAFGGSRHALLDSETQRNALQQIANTEAQGMAAGYDTSAGLLSADLARQLQAAQGNQGANLQAGLANQNATNTGLFRNQDSLNQAGALNAQMQQQTNLANQGAANTGLFRNQDATNSTNQLSAQMQQQSNLANQQAQLSKMGLNLQSAGQQGQLAELAQKMNLTDINQLGNIGQQQQQMNQGNLDMAYNDFLKQQQYPQDNLNMLISTLNQTPYARTTYGSGANTAAQGVGGLAALLGGLSSFLK